MPNRYYDGPLSDHFDGDRFFNPHHPDTDRSRNAELRHRTIVTLVERGER